jgi:hypothetical protein
MTHPTIFPNTFRLCTQVCLLTTALFFTTITTQAQQVQVVAPKFDSLMTVVVYQVLESSLLKSVMVVTYPDGSQVQKDLAGAKWLDMRPVTSHESRVVREINTLFSQGWRLYNANENTTGTSPDQPAMIYQRYVLVK